MKFRSLILTAMCASALALSAGPRYVFLFIGDGMGMGPAIAAQDYNHYVLGDAKPLTMTSLPVVGFCQTYSASSPVTDSAAAGTALSTGSKTNNGMLGVTPDSVAAISVAKKLFDKGWGVGIVTSVAPDDATPGAFYAHVPSRKMYYQIGLDAAASGYQFIAGAGLRGTKDKSGKDNDLIQRLTDAGVQIVRGPEQIKDINSERVMLLNTEGTVDYNIGYTIDSIKGVLTLPLITETCLKHMEKTSPDRFFMMVEGGNIDHALHANDGGAAVKEILNFNEALDLAYQFYLQHKDETLIVVTADHDTGGMTVGNRALHYDAKLDLVDCQKVSKEQFSDYCKAILKSRRIYTWDDMKEYLKENLGFWDKIKVSAEQEANLKLKFDLTFEQRNSADQKTLYASFNAFAVDVFTLLNDAIGFGFTTTSHTGNPVPVFAVGVGADRFKSLNNNILIPKYIEEIVNE